MGEPRVWRIRLPALAGVGPAAPRESRARAVLKRRVAEHILDETARRFASTRAAVLADDAEPALLHARRWELRQAARAYARAVAALED